MKGTLGGFLDVIFIFIFFMVGTLAGVEPGLLG